MDYFTNFIKRDIGNAVKSGGEIKVVIKKADIIDAQIRDIYGEKCDVKTYVYEDRVYFKLRHGWLNMIDLESGDYTYNIWYWDRELKKSGILSEKFYVFSSLK